MDNFKRPKKAVVFLAYSSSDNDHVASVHAYARDWKQLELFGNASTDAVVFIRPDDKNPLEVLVQLQVKHIVDIRDVPYLSFSELSRRKFFDALREINVDYLGMHELMHRHGTDFFPLDERDRTRAAVSDGLVESVSSRLESGPIAVFCDADPKKDEKVGRLLDLLSSRRIKHAPVLAVDS